jgi:hypothetical protein
MAPVRISTKRYLAIRSGDDSMAMPRQLARGLQAKRHSRRREQRPLAECLPHINVNDLPIPRDYQIHVAPNISLRYPYIAGMRIAYDGVEFTHTGRTQIFDFKWIKTGFGYPRPAFICDCGRPSSDCISATSTSPAAAAAVQSMAPKPAIKTPAQFSKRCDYRPSSGSKPTCANIIADAYKPVSR